MCSRFQPAPRDVLAEWAGLRSQACEYAVGQFPAFAAAASPLTQLVAPVLTWSVRLVLVLLGALLLESDPAAHLVPRGSGERTR